MNRIAVTACVALGTVGVIAAATAGAHARGKRGARFADERDLVVTLVTPTTNQEVSSDLSDPGLNNVITVKFSSLLNQRDLIDNRNVFNRLSPKCEFLNSSFQRLPGTPSVRQNVFTFDPFSIQTPVLGQGQYTLNIKSSIRNTRGRLLNNGGADFTTTFSVGTDIYGPVLRKISPIQGQTSIGLNQSIVATFNEPLDSASLIGNVSVVDGSTNPPTTIFGNTSLARNGFDLVFTPDPCFGYPPLTNVQLIINGQGASAPATTATVTDVFQNKFRRDGGLQWQVDPTIPTLYHSPNGEFDELTGQFKLTFQTKGIKPPPQGLRPGGPMMVWLPTASPCSAQVFFAPSCYASGNVVYFTTSNGLGEADLRAYIARYNQGITDFSLISVLPNTPVRMGRPAGVTFDPRVIAPLPTTPSNHYFHTFIYVVNEATGTVDIVRSDNFKVIGRLSGFTSPRDVSVSTNGNQSLTTLYVTNFGSNQLVAVDLEGIVVSFGGQPGAASPCDAIKDNQINRAFVDVGAGPTEVSADGYLQQRVMVCNSLENSMSIVDVKTNKVIQTNEVGSNPVSCDWNVINFGGTRVALVANQGGLGDPNGSVSLYVQSPPIYGGLLFWGPAQNRDGVEATVSDGMKNPTHVFGNSKWLDPFSLSSTGGASGQFWYVSNTGGDTVVDFNVSLQGVFSYAITPGVNNTQKVGLNPTSAIPDCFYPNNIQFASVVGTGSMTAVKTDRSLAPVSIRVPGIRRLYSPFTN